MSSTDTFVAFTEYEPTEAVCILFIAVFLVLLIAHLWQSIRARVGFCLSCSATAITTNEIYQIWYLWPLMLATFLEVVGYILRSVVPSIHDHP